MRQASRIAGGHASRRTGCGAWMALPLRLASTGGASPGETCAIASCDCCAAHTLRTRITVNLMSAAESWRPQNSTGAGIAHLPALLLETAWVLTRQQAVLAAVADCCCTRAAAFRSAVPTAHATPKTKN